MTSSPYVIPVAESTTVFKPDIFKGKVLFCTGGGSGICRGMTEGVVSIQIQAMKTTDAASRCVTALILLSLDGSKCTL